MVNLGRLANQAKRLVDQRGGMDSVKGDAAELKNIAKGSGSLSDKAKQAAAALRQPGSEATTEDATPAAPPVENTTPAAPPVEGTPGPAQE